VLYRIFKENFISEKIEKSFEIGTNITYESIWVVSVVHYNILIYDNSKNEIMR